MTFNPTDLMVIDVLPPGCVIEAEGDGVGETLGRLRMRAINADGRRSQWSGWFAFDGEPIAITWAAFDWDDTEPDEVLDDYDRGFRDGALDATVHLATAAEEHQRVCDELIAEVNKERRATVWFWRIWAASVVANVIGLWSSEGWWPL